MKNRTKPNNDRLLPGKIYKRPDSNILWIIFKKKRVSTGLQDDPAGKGMRAAQKLLDKMRGEYLSNDGHIPEQVVLDIKGKKKKLQESVVTIYEAFAEFEKTCKSANKSETTLTHYRIALKTFFPEDMPLTIDNIRDAVDDLRDNRDKVTNYEVVDKNGKKLNVKRKPVTNSSLNVYLRNLNPFISFCANKKLIPEKLNVKTEFKVKESGKKKPVSYRIDDWDKVINAANEIIKERMDNPLYAKKAKFRSMIDREFVLLLEFMFGCGGRRTESLRLTWDNIDFTRGEIIFPNKEDKKEEVLPISSRLRKVLEELKEIANNRRMPEERQKLFRWSEKTGSKLNRAFTEVEKRAGTKIPGNAFHKIRKTLATRLLENDTPIAYVQLLLRHRDIKTTIESYFHKKLELGLKALEALDKVSDINHNVLVSSLNEKYGQSKTALLLSWLLSMDGEEVEALVKDLNK